MKKYKYSYYIIPIGENGEEAYEAIIPKFQNLQVFGDTPQDLFKAVMETIDDEIKELKKKGLQIPPEDNATSFNGKILLRIPPELHSGLYYAAKANATSLNKYLETIIRKSLPA